MMSHLLRMRDIGEKAFLADFLPSLSADHRFVNGFGHDASVIDLGLPGLDLVMKIDRAAKPLAAINGWSDFKVWGRMAVTANCSDVLAIGGRPAAFMLAVSVDGETPAQTVREIIAGAAEECAAHQIAFLGGDTKEAVTANIVGAAIGLITKGRHYDRRRGMPGDILILAGSVGGFLGGYRACWGSPTPLAAAVEYLARPEAVWTEAQALSQIEGIRSACDLSDGLASGALNLASPGAGIMLEFDSIPFHPLAVESAADRQVDILPYAFGVGDWGILYAADRSVQGTVEALRSNGLKITVVGEIIPHSGLYIRREGLFSVSARENEHFRHRMEDEGDYFEAHESGVTLVPAALLKS